VACLVTLVAKQKNSPVATSVATDILLAIAESNYSQNHTITTIIAAKYLINQ